MHEEFHVGVANRLARRNPQNAFTAGIQHRGKCQIIEKCLPSNTRLGEISGWRQARHYLPGIQVSRIEQLDLGNQRLVQGRLQGQFPEPQRMRHTG